MTARDSDPGISRRDLLRRAACAAGVGTSLSRSGKAAKGSHPSPASRTGTGSVSKTVLSFYVDDTNPYLTGVGAFKKFLDFVKAKGIAGESSVILGFEWNEHGLLSRPATDEQRAYIEQLHRAYECGIDSHMELMTHGGLFDFRTEHLPAGAEHEGIWLYEEHVSSQEYESYFGQILEAGERIGVRFTGVTWPGCACAVCEKRYGELFKGGPHVVNPNVWKALLSLARQGKFRGPTVPCFVLEGSETQSLTLKARDGKFGVYDLYPNAEDRFGIWENNPSHVNPDYYITADGKSGRVVEKIRAGAPHCLFYAHWQGVNPFNGVGWPAFQQVIERIQKHYGDRVIWMRPSALTDAYHSQAKAQGA